MLYEIVIRTHDSDPLCLREISLHHIFSLALINAIEGYRKTNGKYPSKEQIVSAINRSSVIVIEMDD